jgi:hypothetical protein
VVTDATAATVVGGMVVAPIVVGGSADVSVVPDDEQPTSRRGVAISTSLANV